MKRPANMETWGRDKARGRYAEGGPVDPLNKRSGPEMTGGAAGGFGGGASGRKVTIHHHPDYGEYRVGKGRESYYTTDKQDAADTARKMYGNDSVINYRSKRYDSTKDDPS